MRTILPRLGLFGKKSDFKGMIVRSALFISLLLAIAAFAQANSEQASAATGRLSISGDGRILLNRASPIQVTEVSVDGFFETLNTTPFGMQSPTSQSLFDCSGFNIGVTVGAGTFGTGELMFRLTTPSSGPGARPGTPEDYDKTYFTGPASRNPDGFVHAHLTQIDGDTVRIGWEDLYLAIPPSPVDVNYSDCVVDVTASTKPAPTITREKRSIVYVQGILSKGDCNGNDFPSWLKDFSQNNPTIKARVDLTRQYYFSYSDGCSYSDRNTCDRGIDEIYYARLKGKIQEATNDGSRVTIIAHSQGGFLTAYTVGRLRSEDESLYRKIASVVTFDSFPHGLPFLYLNVLDKFYGSKGCPDPSPSVHDWFNYPFQKDDTDVAEIAAQRFNGYQVAFYTIDATDFDFPTSLAISGWTTDITGRWMHAEFPGTHNSIWSVRASEKERFLCAAILRSMTRCPQASDRIFLGQNLAVNFSVPSYTTSVAFVSGWSGSTVKATLEAPNGDLYGPNGADCDAYDVGPTYEVCEIANPQVGDWTMHLYGADVPAEGEEVEASALILAKSDEAPPETTASIGPPSPDGARGWYVSDVTVSLSAIDPDPGDGSVVSGVANTYIAVDEGSFETYSGPVTVSEEGFHTVQYYSEDFAGNIEAIQAVQFKIDKTRPDIAITSGTIDGIIWDEAHLERGILTNENTVALVGEATDNLCLWELRSVDTDSGQATASQQPVDPNVPDWPPPYPPDSLSYSLAVPLHTGINNIDIVAEDCAGWTKDISIQIVYVIPGRLDPRSKGFWYDAVKTHKYTNAEIQTLLDYINVASDVWGNDSLRNRYGPLTLDNYRLLLGVPDSAIMEQKLKAQLLANWLNLVSGRLAVKTPVEVSNISGYWVVMDDIGGNPLTYAYKVDLEIEEKIQPSVAPFIVNWVSKNLAEAVNLQRILS